MEFDKNILMWGEIIILAILALYTSFVAGGVDLSTVKAATSSVSSSGMVGGC